MNTMNEHPGGGPVAAAYIFAEATAAHERLIAAGRVRRLLLTPHLINQRRAAWDVGELSPARVYTFERMTEIARRLRLSGDEFRCVLAPCSLIWEYDHDYVTPTGEGGRTAETALAYCLDLTYWPLGPDGRRYHYTDPLVRAMEAAP